MRYLKLLLLTVLLTPTARTLAQKDHARKILGCWVFQKIEYDNKAVAENAESPAPNSVTVCFEAGGTYTTTEANSNTPITGTYAVSADGKTITQQRDNPEEGTLDENAVLSFININSMVLQLEFARLYFERKNKE
ncbi:lipocalin family protein [Flavobacterium sp.]|uniref:lipocalin family protein n=1 Tax=Flavobacterium sp. TaxID=239 RepID=UPI002FDC9422